MLFRLKKIYAWGFLLFWGCQFANAQKNIIISDSLKVNADILKVKMGFTSFGKIPKFHFGDYAVASSKLGWTISSSTDNIINTKTESKSAQKFSFTLTNKENDSAKVNAAKNISSQSLNSFRLFKNFSWGDDELLVGSMNFSAYISINGDTASMWTLIMKDETGTQTEGKYEAFLTDGNRRIFIYPRSSDKNGKSDSFTSAFGYEFIENGRSYCALQYWAGGMFPQNSNTIWLNKGLDPKMKLVLSAAMIAILELKMGEQTAH